MLYQQKIPAYWESLESNVFQADTRNVIPTRDELYNTEYSDTADRLLSSLNSAKREKSLNFVKSLNFTLSSRKAWSLFK